MVKMGATRRAHFSRRTTACCGLLTAFFAVQPGLASPYRITGLGAAETWEVKMIGKYADKKDEEHLWNSAVDLTAPILPGLETSVTFGRGLLQEAGERDRWGMLDTEWAVKWEVVPLRDGQPLGVTVEPALIIPTGTRGLGDKEYRAAFPVVIGSDFGKLRLRGLVGYEHSLESSDDEISGGVLVEYRPSSRFSLGGEITTRMPSTAMAEHKDIVDIGFKYEIREGWEVQGRLGQTIRTHDHIRGRDAALYLEIAL